MIFVNILYSLQIWETDIPMLFLTLASDITNIVLELLEKS